MTLSLLRDPAWEGDVKIPGPPPGLENELSGRWPRMLSLDEETESRLTEYLDSEISLVWSERNILVQDWIQWQKDYWAKPASTVKNFPFRKAANVVIPMTAIAVEAVLARLITTLFSVKPFYSLRPRIAAWINEAPNVESWLQTEVDDPNSLDMPRFAQESLLELIKLGTAVGKSGYERDIRKVNIDLPEGGSVGKWIEVRNGATLDYVPLANFLMRLHENNPQTAMLVGEEHHNVTWSQLKRHALSGRMYPEAIESIRMWWSNTPSTESSGVQYEASRRTQENAEPGWKETFDFQELWLSFDVDKDGVDEEIVIDFHKESRTVLSARYNWYADAHRPYRIGVYIPVEGRWAGIGIGKQLEQFQALITAIHRQRLDAGTLANMGQLALSRTSGYSQDEPIWPGKIWFFNNPQTDVKEFHLSNLQHFAQLSNEDSARGYADKRSGANELILGSPQIGTPPPATSDLSKLAEGNKKFDMVLKNVRRMFSLLGQDVLANYQQFGSRGRSWLVRGEGGKYVEHYLAMPQEDVRRGVYVELTVTDSITNKDVEQQKWIQLFSALSAHYDKVLERAGQVAGLMQDPQVFIMFADMALRSANAAMRRLLDAFQVPDVDSFLLDLEKMRAQNAGPTGGAESSPGTPAGSEEAALPTGVEQLVEAFGASGGGDGAGNGVGGGSPGMLG
jgi:hypothetical protein